jgi:hypothetical protein
MYSRTYVEDPSQDHYDHGSGRPHEVVDLSQRELREQRYRHAVVMQAVSRWARADLQLMAAVERDHRRPAERA